MRIAKASLLVLVSLGAVGCLGRALEENTDCIGVTTGCGESPGTSSSSASSSGRPTSFPGWPPDEGTGTGTGGTTAGTTLWEGETFTHTFGPTDTTTPPEPGDGCAEQEGSRARFVFVTSNTFDGSLEPAGDCGKLSGLLRADCLCGTAAAARMLPGIYVAWLSDGDTDMATLLAKEITYAVHFIKTNPQRTCVAGSLDELLGGTLRSPIDTTESGQPWPDPTARVWTGSYANGEGVSWLGFAASCSGWGGVGYAATGHIGRTDRRWSYPHAKEDEALFDPNQWSLDQFQMHGCLACHDGQTVPSLPDMPPPGNCGQYRPLYCIQIVGPEPDTGG